MAASVLATVYVIYYFKDRVNSRRTRGRDVLFRIELLPEFDDVNTLHEYPAKSNDSPPVLDPCRAARATNGGYALKASQAKRQPEKFLARTTVPRASLDYCNV